MSSKYFIITGTTSGLGAFLAETFLEKGYGVAGVARRDSGIKNERYRHFRSDLTSLENTDLLMQSILDCAEVKNAEFLCLINNAASSEPLATADSLLWQQVPAQITLNLTVPLVLTGAFLRMTRNHLCPRRVVMLTSGLSTLPMAGLGSYAASKAGLEQFVRCLNKESGDSEKSPKAIAVNPGMMDTPMQEMVRQSDPEVFPSSPIFAKARSAGQVRNPKDVAVLLAELLENQECWKTEIHHV